MTRRVLYLLGHAEKMGIKAAMVNDYIFPFGCARGYLYLFLCHQNYKLDFLGSLWYPMNKM